MAEKRFGLPREERVRKRKDFDRVFKDGRRVTEGPIYARYVPNGLAFTRVGVAVSTKFGKAVRRNRARRLLKEAFRLHKDAMPPGLDIVLLPGSSWDDPPLCELEKCMVRIGGKLSKKHPAPRETGNDD